MQQFRKKPVIVEAMRYSIDSRDKCIEFCGAVHTAIDDDGAEYELQNLRIVTLEGTMFVQLGDWIIKGVKGEYYPCKHDIFIETYEPVT
jgi:hypothetical protein